MSMQSRLEQRLGATTEASWTARYFNCAFLRTVTDSGYKAL